MEFDTTIFQLLTNELPQWMKDVLVDSKDDENFAKFLAECNRKYLETHVKPAQESVEKSMKQLYQKISQYIIDDGGKMNV